MKASRETIRRSRECIECGKKMVGIISYEARKICDECGGKPDIDREKKYKETPRDTPE